MSQARKDTDALLRSLGKKGFIVEERQGGLTLVAPNGNRLNRPSRNFKVVKTWAEKQMTEKRRTEKVLGGQEVQARAASSKRSRLADGTLSHWDRLPDDAKLDVVEEMLHRLGKDGNEAAFDALRGLQQ